MLLLLSLASRRKEDEGGVMALLRKRKEAVEVPPSSQIAAAKPVDVVEKPKLSAKFKQVALFGLLCLFPYGFALLRYYDVDEGLKTSIIINFVMSVGAFILTVLLIPVAARYVLRRNMFGYDLNKKGSPAGSVKVPESLGLVPGLVYLVVIILFQHFYFTPDSAVCDITSLTCGKTLL